MKMIDNVFASYIMQNEMDKEDLIEELRAAESNTELARKISEAVAAGLISQNEIQEILSAVKPSF
jgi:hypothetical protein